MAIFKTSTWVVAFTASTVLALAGATAAQALVPPDNSAVNQYTETYPTARGGKGTQQDGRTQRSATEVLGAGNARRLQAQGSAGEAAAEVAALTAPMPVGGEARGGEGSGTDRPERSAGAPPPDGSSGLGRIVEEATGASSSEGTGVVLPLALLATALWALAYLWRRKHTA